MFEAKYFPLSAKVPGRTSGRHCEGSEDSLACCFPWSWCKLGITGHNLVQDIKLYCLEMPPYPAQYRCLWGPTSVFRCRLAGGCCCDDYWMQSANWRRSTCDIINRPVDILENKTQIIKIEKKNKNMAWNTSPYRFLFYEY